MSKSAIYAGLGRGLMSLGESASDAMKMLTLEQLRQRNIDENWRRQSQENKQDRQFRREEGQANRTLRRDLLESQNDKHEGLMAMRRDEVQGNDVKWSADRLIQRVRDLDNRYSKAANSLLENLPLLGEKGPQQLAALEASYKSDKANLLKAAPSEIVQAAGLSAFAETKPTTQAKHFGKDREAPNIAIEVEKPHRHRDDGTFYWPHEVVSDISADTTQAVGESIGRNAAKFQPTKQSPYDFKAWDGF